MPWQEGTSTRASLGLAHDLLTSAFANSRLFTRVHSHMLDSHMFGHTRSLTHAALRYATRSPSGSKTTRGLSVPGNHEPTGEPRVSDGLSASKAQRPTPDRTEHFTSARLAPNPWRVGSTEHHLRLTHRATTRTVTRRALPEVLSVVESGPDCSAPPHHEPHSDRLRRRREVHWRHTFFRTAFG
jgi:hypothetical protein